MGRVRRRSARLAATAAVLVTLASTVSMFWPEVSAQAAPGGTTVRVSLGSGGAEASGANSGEPTVSGDGRYVAFVSGATNLVAGDTNGAGDVFVRDTVGGTTSRDSVHTSGAQGDGASSSPSLSSNAQWVAFHSAATNLVAGDTNAKLDVFLRDRSGAGMTIRVSVATGGTEATGGDSTAPSVSGDGRYVVFTSTATNLVAGDTNGVADVFLRDTVGGTTVKVSSAPAGADANGVSGQATISADGTTTAFSSTASNLVADVNGQSDVFTYAIGSGTISLVSLTNAGAQTATFGSFNPALSDNARYVAFESLDSTLVSGDTNELYDVFVRDTTGATTTRESVTSNGAQGIVGGSGQPRISADGRYVAFDSTATNLVGGDTNRVADLFLRDRTLSVTTRVSVTPSGQQTNGPSTKASISLDGQSIAFASSATNVVSGDTNAVADSFLRSRAPAELTLLTPDILAPGATGITVTLNGAGFAASPVVTFGQGVTVASVTSASATQIVVIVNVAAGAAVQYNDIVVTSGGTEAWCYACVWIGSGAPSGATTTSVALATTSTTAAATTTTTAPPPTTTTTVPETTTTAPVTTTTTTTTVPGPTTTTTTTVPGPTPTTTTTVPGPTTTTTEPGLGAPPAVGGTGGSPAPGGSQRDGASQGYYLVASDGRVLAFGSAADLGAQTVNPSLATQQIAGFAARLDGGTGYWMVTAQGKVFAFNGAPHLGDVSAISLNRPIVGIASTRSGLGYWLVAGDGGIFSFGDAGFFGSTGSIVLNKPIVGMAATTTGLGYWMVATDGGIFGYGDAGFFGSTGGLRLNKPIVGMAPTAGGTGYWLVATDGGIFAFGDAGFFGSTGGIVLNKPVIGMAPTTAGRGYWLISSDGGVFAYGDAPFLGSATDRGLNRPVIGVVPVTPPATP